MSTTIRLSGKNLGALALADCCARCFWLQLRMGFSLPYQIFPGIFSSIDSYSKHTVHRYFDRHGRQPPWLDPLGTFRGYIDPPHHTKFSVLVEPHDILLTGVPDGLLVRSDGSILIADYKTARYTDTQDALLPMYEVQLNAYALIAERCDIGPVSGLALIYFEPRTAPSDIRDGRWLQDGFDMGFGACIHTVAQDLTRLDPLLARARMLYNQPLPPAGRAGCRNCRQIGEMLTLCGAPLAREP